MTEQTDIPDWAYERADKLADGETTPTLIYRNAFARYIAQHEQRPVDPLLLEAREICAKHADAKGYDVTARFFREGKYDDDEVQTVLAGLRRGVEIGRAG